MKLLSLKSHGFGCLPDGFELQFPESGVVCIIGPNERGKSTLVRALLAGLYGQPPKNRGKDKTPLNDTETFIQAYTPWGVTNRAPGLTLVVATQDNRRIALEHRFATDKHRRVRMVNLDTGEDITPSNIEHLGQSLTRLPLRAFEKSVLLLQNQLHNFEQTESSELIQALETLVTNNQTDITPQKALARLEDAEKQRDPLSGTDSAVKLATILKRLEDGLQAAQRRHTALLQTQQQYQQEYQALAQVEAALARAVEERDIQARRVRMAEYQQATQALVRHESALNTITELQNQLTGLESPEALQQVAPAQVETVAVMLDEYQHTLHQAEGEAVQRQQAANQARDALGVYRWAGDATDTRDIEPLLATLEGEYTKFQTAQGDVQAKQENLRQQGQPVQRFMDLRAQLAPLPPDSREQLRVTQREHADLTQAILDKQSHLNTLENEAKKQSQRGFKPYFGIAAVCLLLAGGSSLLPMVLAMVSQTIAWALAGTFVVLTGICLFVARQKQKTAGNPQHLQTLQAELAELHTQATAKQEILNGICQTLATQFPQVSDPGFLDNLQWYSQAETEAFKPLADALLVAASREHDLAATCRKVADALLCPWGPDIPVTYEMIRPEVTEYRRFLQNKRQWEEAEAMAQQARKAAMDKQTEYSAQQHKLIDLLQAAGIADPSPLDAALAQFRQWSQALEEQNKVRQYLLTDEQLATYRQWQARAADCAGETPPPDLKDPTTEQNMLETLRAQCLNLETQRNQMQISTPNRQDEFHQQIAEVNQEIETLQAELVRHRQYSEALQLAMATLNQVAEADTRQWAEVLNTSVNNHLNALGSPYSQFHFAPNLAFSFKDRDDQFYNAAQRWPTLSHGARDQIYFAIRLALADHLGQEAGQLPLILDDPFVHFDDQRFSSALQALSRLAAKGRQILLLTCHQQRTNTAVEQLQAEGQSDLYLQYLETFPQNLVLAGDP